MARNNYESIPSSYPEDETALLGNDNSIALRPKIDFRKRIASIVVLVASVACITFLTTFKGSNQSTFQTNNLPEATTSFSEVIAGISPTRQPSGSPTYASLWPGTFRPKPPTSPSTPPTKTLKPGGSRTPRPTKSKPPRPASPTSVSAGDTGAPQEYMREKKSKLAGATGAPVEEVNSRAPVIVMKGNHESKLFGHSDAPHEEVRPTLKASHKTKLFGHSEAPHEEARSSAKASHKNKLHEERSVKNSHLI